MGVKFFQFHVYLTERGIIERWTKSDLVLLRLLRYGMNNSSSRDMGSHTRQRKIFYLGNNRTHDLHI